MNENSNRTKINSDFSSEFLEKFTSNYRFTYSFFFIIAYLKKKVYFNKEMQIQDSNARKGKKTLYLK